jgi:hypothetical protein
MRCSAVVDSRGIGPTRHFSAYSQQRVIDTRRPTCVSSTSIQHVGQSVPARRFAITSDGRDGAQVAAVSSDRTRMRRCPSCRRLRFHIRHRRSRTCCRSVERARASAASGWRGDTLGRRDSSLRTRRSCRARPYSNFTHEGAPAGLRTNAFFFKAQVGILETSRFLRSARSFSAGAFGVARASSYCPRGE